VSSDGALGEEAAESGDRGDDASEAAVDVEVVGAEGDGDEDANEGHGRGKCRIVERYRKGNTPADAAI
jgi:hypothetical protein